MFNVIRKPDSTNLYIELTDQYLDINYSALELKTQVSEFLVKEFIEKHGQELLSKINLEELSAELPKKVAQALVEHLFASKGAAK